MAIRDSWSHAGPCCVNQAKVGMGSAHLRLSFGVLQDCHGVGVWGRMAHDGWSKHSSQVTDVHPSFCSGSDSARVEGASISVCHTIIIDINTLSALIMK